MKKTFQWLFLLLVTCGLLFGLAQSSVEPSNRSNIASFKVMDVLARAFELEAEGRDICHMEAGQPSTPAPEKVIAAAAAALQKDKIGYTNSLGILPLRTAIANYYSKKYGVTVSPNRVVITTGSSAGFLLAFMGLFDVGASVALASSGYPCYRNIMSATGLDYVTIPVNSQFKVTAKELSHEIERRKEDGLQPLKGLILSSPSNPTGAMLSPQELKELCELCDANGMVFLSDEIYHGITYGDQVEATAIQFSDKPVIINSFSKYFSMCGWRLGWLIVPESCVDVMNRLSQNFYISAPTISQIAGCVAFDCEEELEKHVARYAVNRGIVINTLHELGLDTNIAPADGAFYIYCDLSHAGVTDTPSLCRQVLEEAGVGLTPGSDFEDPKSGLGLRRLRFSFCRETEEVKEGMARFKSWWIKHMMIKK